MLPTVTPINICCFGSVTDKKPKHTLLNGIDQLVEFFTTNDPPVVEKDQRRTLFSMATYKAGTTRGKANIESISGVVLDFDNKEPDWHPISEIVERLKLQNVAYLHYTTWSHTADHPKWRLIIPFNKAVSIEAWADVYTRVLHMLQNPSGIDQPASGDVAHIWFMPYKQLGQPYDIGYRLADTFLDPYTLPPVPDAVQVSKEQSLVSYEQANPSSYDNYPPATLDDVSEVFISISPNMAYNSWLEMGMALKTHFGEPAFPAWNQWSSSGTTYEGIAALQEKWASFKGTGINIGTFFHHAKAAGYIRNPSSRPYASHVPATISSAKRTSKETLPELADLEIEEEEAREDPIEKCSATLEPFAVADIYDLPCPVLKNAFDWIHSVAHRPQPLFSLSTTLSLMAFLKREAVISDSELKANLYVLVIGGSRTGKDNAIRRIPQILKILGLLEFLVSGIGSSQGLMQQLSEKGGKSYWVQDEMAYVFQSLKDNNAPSHIKGIQQKLLSLYGGTYTTTDRIKAEKVIAIEKPFLNLYGVTTENIIDHLSPDSVVSGLLPRFLIFQLDRTEKMPKINKNTNISPPQELTEALRAINEQREPKIAKLEADAEAWLDAFSEKIDYCHEMLYSKGIKIASLVGNLREQTIKLALLATRVVLVPRGASAPSIEYEEQTVITLKAIKWAASVAMHSFKNSVKLAQSLSESSNEEYLNKIMSRLEEGREKE